ncbi:DEAD/DEAH box helicase [Vreelandella titanicae]|nr:DEAD/DEAH box helicase family protein [Halomonas titanicae]
MGYFFDTPVNIETNNKLRTPQIEAYLKIRDYFAKSPSGEALVVLPTGTGKSGLVSIAPFGTSKGRVLIIAPGLVTKQSIQKTQEALYDNFWINHDVLFDSNHIPIVSEFTPSISLEHLEQSNFVYSNIQKLGSSRSTGLLNRVPPDFFDMVIVDEAHHAPASTWREVLDYFKTAKKLHVTGTPYRGDGQEIPGDRIHETPLSEAMRSKYIKWLRKDTLNSEDLFFTTPELPGKKLTKEEVLKYKEKEWVEKSIALSARCSKEIVDHSLLKLKELKATSPSVPHKILAVGCSISHAEELLAMYEECGVNAVLIHSKMEPEDIAENFRLIDSHQCHVVVSVNMLMEGYDHKYLSILAIFRPYKSQNAFAQVVGRVLRAIPEDEITAHEIDNNALVIYHEETGLDDLWISFQKEVTRSKKTRIVDYTDLSESFEKRETYLADITSSDSYVSGQESYLEDLDFNKLFAEKRDQIQKNIDTKVEELRKSGSFNEDDINEIAARFREKEKQRASADIDEALIRKRPDQARKALRQLLKQKAAEEATNILSDAGLDEKGTELYAKFARLIPYAKPNSTNDAVLAIYFNAKLANKFGPVANRDNNLLLASLDDVAVVAEEIRRMLK